MIDNYKKKVYSFVILLNLKKIFLSIAFSSICSCAPLAFLWFAVACYAAKLSLNLYLDLLAIFFGSSNLFLNTISGGFPAGLALGISAFGENLNHLLLSVLLFLYVAIYYSPAKTLLPDTSFIMELAICFLTTKTCLGMLRC